MSDIEAEGPAVEGRILLFPSGSDIAQVIALPCFNNRPTFDKICEGEGAAGDVLVEVSTKELIFLATAVEFVSKPMHLLMSAPDGDYNQNWFLYRAQFESSVQYPELLASFEGPQEEEVPVAAGRTPRRKATIVRHHDIGASDEAKAAKERAQETPPFHSTADDDE